MKIWLLKIFTMAAIAFVKKSFLILKSFKRLYFFSFKVINHFINSALLEYWFSLSLPFWLIRKNVLLLRIITAFELFLQKRKREFDFDDITHVKARSWKLKFGETGCCSPFIFIFLFFIFPSHYFKKIKPWSSYLPKVIQPPWPQSKLKLT